MLDRVFADWPLKVLAMVLAFGLWVVIANEDQAVQDFTIPLEVEVGLRRTLTDLPPTEVKVRLTGPKTQIKKLERVALAAQIDLGSDLAGDHEIQFSVEHLTDLPSGVAVGFFEPDRIMVTVEEELIRDVLVIPDTRGVPPSGFAFYRTVAHPSNVRVKGPASAIRDLNELRTIPIELDNRTGSFVSRVGLDTSLPMVRVVTPSPIEVRVIIDSAPVERTFFGVPVTVSGAEYEMEVLPPSTEVTLTGPRAVLDNLRTDNIRVVGDASGLSPGSPHRIAIEAGFGQLPTDEARRLNVKSVSPTHVFVQLVERSAGI